MSLAMSLEVAAQATREAMRETVKRHSPWYFLQASLMILASILLLVHPAVSSFAAGCVLIVDSHSICRA